MKNRIGYFSMSGSEGDGCDDGFEVVFLPFTVIGWTNMIGFFL